MGERRKNVTGWHPLTKLLLGLGVVALPYLVLTQEESAPAAATSPAAPILPAPVDPAANAGPFVIPDLSVFASTVERPLFSPGRRPPQAALEPVVEEATVVDVPEETPKPDLKFFGTLTQGGRTLALITPGDGSGAQRLGMGDHFAEWEVREVAPDRLTLGLGDSEAVFTIFDEKSHAADRTAKGPDEPAAHAAVDADPPADVGAPADDESSATSDSGEDGSEGDSPDGVAASELPPPDSAQGQ